MRLSKEIKIRIVVLFSKSQSFVVVKRALKAEGFKEIPSNPSIQNVFHRFCQTGSIADFPRVPKKKKIQETQKAQIEAILEEKPKSTLSEISSQVQLSRTTIYRFMHLELNAKSYKIQIHQRLFEEDYDRRVETAETLLPYINNPAMENLIFFLTKPLSIYLAMFINRTVEYGLQKNQQKSMNTRIKQTKLMFGVQCHQIA
jgi:hypothetical protein